MPAICMHSVYVRLIRWQENSSGLSKPVSWASCLVWGKLGSISNSLFDPAVSDPDSHIMQMDGAIYSCQVPQTPARPNGGTSPFEIIDTIWGGIRPPGVGGPDTPPTLV